MSIRISSIEIRTHDEKGGKMHTEQNVFLYLIFEINTSYKTLQKSANIMNSILEKLTLPCLTLLCFIKKIIDLSNFVFINLRSTNKISQSLISFSLFN